MSGHNAAHEMAQSPLEIKDPGDAGAITIDRQDAVVELVTTVAGGETRTLTTPTAPGQRACIRMKTDGGDAVITASAGLNVAGNTVATYADVGDALYLISVSATTGYRWEIIVNTGAVGLA